MPRHSDPALEKRILGAASRLWARGGEKSLTMRAVAKVAGTTTPTVYERYRDREDILRALRLETRRELFAELSRTHTLRESVERYLQFALEHSYAYEVLFDGIAKPPSLYEPWPSFNLMRERVARLIGTRGHDPDHLMLSIWCLMHGTAMLIIRGNFEGALRTQAIHCCQDAVDTLLKAAQRNELVHSGPKWPANLILGEGRRSKTGNDNGAALKRGTKRKAPPR